MKLNHKDMFLEKYLEKYDKWLVWIAENVLKDVFLVPAPGRRKKRCIIIPICAMVAGSV
jgi:hypothetical protein